MVETKKSGHTLKQLSTSDLGKDTFHLHVCQCWFVFVSVFKMTFMFETGHVHRNGIPIINSSW